MRARVCVGARALYHAGARIWCLKRGPSPVCARAGAAGPRRGAMLRVSAFDVLRRQLRCGHGVVASSGRATSTFSQHLEARGPSYLDMQATTPVDPRVLDAMLPWFGSRFGNPHSRSHAYGWDAEEATEKAREQIAALINADPREIFFTSGATESNNMAVKGIAAFYGGAKKHIVTTQTEHKCVLASCRRLEVEQGFEVTYLGVGKAGLCSETRTAQ